MLTNRIAPLRTTLTGITTLLFCQSVLPSAAVAAPAPSRSQVSIASVVLTTGDVAGVYGQGFKSFINGVISNKDLAIATKTAKVSSGVSPMTTGRVTGYDSVWFRGTRTSYLSVTNAVNEYRSSSFPQAALGQMGHYNKIHSGVTFHISPFNGPGDQAFRLTMSSRGTTALGILFRRGRYFAEILVAEPHGTVSLSSVVKLATIEDQRIQAHS